MRLCNFQHQHPNMTSRLHFDFQYPPHKRRINSGCPQNGALRDLAIMSRVSRTWEMRAKYKRRNNTRAFKIRIIQTGTHVRLDGAVAVVICAQFLHDGSKRIGFPCSTRKSERPATWTTSSTEIVPQVMALHSRVSCGKVNTI